MRIQLINNFEGENVAAYEEAIIKADIGDVISIWKQPSIIYLPNRASINFFDTEYAKRLNYPIVRSKFFLGATTSAVVVGNTWGILCKAEALNIENAEEFENKFAFGAFQNLLKKLNIETIRKSNDLIIQGEDKKIAGVVSTKNEKKYICNSFLNIKKQDGFDYNAFYKLPASKFEGKTVDNPLDRVATILDITGDIPDDQYIVDAFIEYFGSIGINAEIENGLSTDEKNIYDSIKEKYRSDEWINYGRITTKPDFE